jgi:flavin-dependent dehydrogenase
VDHKSTDILVIGGGPAGSTFGNLAAQRGWQVTLLEKDEHPRFHIGESLLPMTRFYDHKGGCLPPQLPFQTCFGR